MAWEISSRHPGQIGSIGIRVFSKENAIRHRWQAPSSSITAATSAIPIRIRRDRDRKPQGNRKGRLPPIELTAQRFKSDTPALAESRQVYFDASLRFHLD